MPFCNKNKILISILTEKKIWMLILILPVCGVLIGFPWNTDTMFEVFYYSFYYHNIMMGLFLAYLIALSFLYKTTDNSMMLIHMKKRSTYIKFLLQAVVEIALALSLYYMAVNLLIGKCFIRDGMDWGGIEMSFPMLMMTFLRSTMALFCLLFLLGMIYLVTALASQNTVLSSVVVYIFYGVDIAATFYTGISPVICRYIPKSVLYFQDTEFVHNMPYMLGFACVGGITLIYQIIKKDFLHRKGDE
jgi:hypothetical protein